MLRKTDDKLEALAELEPLLMKGDRVVFEKGKNLLEEGEMKSEFFILLKGKADVLKKTIAGIKKPIAELSEGDFVGEGLVGGAVPSSVTIQAASKVTAIRLTEVHLEELRKEDPTTFIRFLLSALNITDRRLEHTDQKLMTLFEISHALNMYRGDLKALGSAIVSQLLHITESKEGLLMIRDSDRSLRVIYSSNPQFSQKSLKEEDLKKTQRKGGLMIARLEEAGVLALRRKADYNDDQLRFMELVADQVTFNLKEAALRASEQARKLLEKY